MAGRGANFKWYDGVFLSMLPTSIVFVVINWKRYHLCAYPLQTWIVVDYSAVFILRLLLFVDNGIAAGIGLDFGWQQRYACFVRRFMVLSILSLLLYPFLWGWTIIGIMWFAKGIKCLAEQGLKWGFLVWLLLSYFGLLCIAYEFIVKLLRRRRALLGRAQQGIPVSIFGVLVDMIRVPEWAFEAEQELRGMDQENPYLPRFYLTPAQREAMEALIQELPRFSLRAVPTDCTECPICLEEFYIGDEVHGLPCAHNFHVECIDKWLRLNIKCPRCRCLVFPNLDFSTLSNILPNTEMSSSNVVSDTRRIITQPSSQSYILRMEGLLQTVGPVHTTNVEMGPVQNVPSQSSTATSERSA